MKVYVGSTALKYHISNWRTPKDLDIWTDEGDNIKGDVSIVPLTILSKLRHKNGYVIPDDILTIKMSHLGWDIKFEKHKKDRLHLLYLGYKVNLPLYNTLVKWWKDVHHNKPYLSLYKSKDKFFNDYVEYIYDHDYLHELAAGKSEPIYKKCLKEGEQVAIDKTKFNQLSFLDQIRMFKEEIAVIACERWLLNPKSKIDNFRKAWYYSLRKTITSLTKNWATDFIVLNLNCFSKPDYEIISNITTTINNGVLKMKTDIKPFSDFMEQERPGEQLEYIIFLMCEGDIDDLCDENILKEKYDYEHLHQDGGGEGGAESCEGVFRFMGKIYKGYYSYASYQGYDYDYILDDLHEVQPKQKTITVYE